MPAPARGRVIAQVGRLVEANKEALAKLVTREVGKPYPESLGEVQEIVDTCDFFLGEGRRLYGQTVPSEMPDKQLFTFRVPVGVAAIVTAGNFPVAVPAWYLVPAILCGNAVVWKPAEYSAALGDALVKLFHAGGVPGGVLNLVQASGEETFAGLEAALAEGLVDKVGFTGSSAVGSKIGELCGRHLQSPCLELGGKNPMVVMDDADVDLAVEGALFGGFGTAGQRCTSLGTAIVHESVHDEFVRKLAERLESAPIGDPFADVLYGPMIHERFAERFEDWLGLIRDHHTVHGSSARGPDHRRTTRATGFVGDPDAGLFYHPALVVGVTRATTRSTRRRRSARSSAWPGSRASTRRWSWPTATATGSRRRSTRARASTRSASASGSPPAWCRSTTRPRAPRRTCRSAATASPATARASPGIWVLDQFTRWQSMNWDYAGKLQKAQMDLVELPAQLDFRL